MMILQNFGRRMFRKCSGGKNRTLHRQPSCSGNVPATLASLLLAVSAAMAAENSSVQDLKTLSQKNIFDPNRHGVGAVARPVIRAYDPSRVAKAEGFSLVGTLLYDKVALAFFTGSDVRYNKALQTANSIADFRIAEVGPSYVVLDSEGQQTKLSVGMQMKRLDGAGWQILSGTMGYTRITATTSVAGASSYLGGGSSGSSGGEDDARLEAIRKKMELRRLKEK
jgi:hypothetical protein